MSNHNKIIHGDCREELKSLPDNLVACCITDPPYNYEFIGHKWNHQEIKRRLERIKESKTLVKNIPYGSGLAGGVRNARWYKKNRENIINYQRWCFDWGKELFRVCKPGAYVAVFNSTRTISHVQVALEDAGFYARDILVYRRHAGIPKGLNYSKKLEKMGQPNSDAWDGWHSCLRNEWEAIALVQKPLVNNYFQTIEEFGVGLMKAIDSGGSFKTNIIEDVKRSRSDSEVDGHCTVKPLELMERLVELLVPPSQDNIVIDPFAGSGTTLLAAKNRGNSYIGIEVEEAYIKIMNERLARKLEPKLTSKRVNKFKSKDAGSGNLPLFPLNSLQD